MTQCKHYCLSGFLLPIWELLWLIIPDIYTFLLSGLRHLTWQPINFNGLFGLRYPQPLECRVTSLLSCNALVDMLLTAGGRYQYGRVGLLRVYMQQRHYLCSTDAQSFWILSLLTEPCFSLNTYLKYLLFMLWSKQIWPHWYYWVRNFEDATYVPLFINIALFSVHMLFLYTIRLSNNPEKIISRFPQKNIKLYNWCQHWQ